MNSDLNAYEEDSDRTKIMIKWIWAVNFIKEAILNKWLIDLICAEHRFHLNINNILTN